jgi:hypothetical protein
MQACKFALFLKDRSALTRRQRERLLGILVARDRSGQTLDWVPGKGPVAPAQLHEHLTGRLEPDVLLVTDAHAAYRAFAREAGLSHEVAAAVGQGNVVVMRGNGAVIAAPSLDKALVPTWYLEDAARVEPQLRSAGLEAAGAVLDDEQAALRATDAGRIFERMWDYLTAGDPESATDS